MSRFGLFLTFGAFLAGISAVQAEDIRVGVLASLSGNWAAVGENERRGLELAADEVNARGGVPGRKISFDYQDTHEETSGAGVVTAFRYLRSRGVELFIGPTGVPGEKALGPIAGREKIVVISPNGGPQIQTYGKNLFNSAGTNEQTSRASARLAAARGARRAGVFSSVQPWEADQARFFADEFQKQGGKIAAAVAPEPTTSDLKVEALTLVRADPEVVFFACFNQLPIASQEMYKLNYRKAKFAAQIDAAHLTGAEAALEGAEFYLFTPPTAEFVRKFRARFGQDPDFPAPYAYDAIVALAGAIARAGTLQPEDVASALHEISFESSSGESLRFGREGIVARGLVLMEVRGGKIVRLP